MTRPPHSPALAALALIVALFPACDRYPSVQPGGSDIHVRTTPDSALTRPAPAYVHQVVNTYPHDASAYTQGLVYRDSVLYEGTGQYPYFGPGHALNGSSTLRRVKLETGQVLQSVPLSPEHFGEGIVDLGDELVQLTWLSHTGFVYDLRTFSVRRTFTYPTEGWGLTHDGRRFIMSDGSANLTFRDSRTLAEIGRVEVRDHRGPVRRLNELEYVNGEVFANVWTTNYIVRIDPVTGRVTGWIDLTGLPPGPGTPSDADAVLNGIAYDPAGDRLFVTGKLWSRLYEIRLVPRN